MHKTTLIRLFASILWLSFLLAGPSRGQWQEVFSTDFNTGVPAQVTGAGSSVSVFGWAGLGSGQFVFDGNMLRNDTNGTVQQPTRLILAGLPSHDALRLQFLWALIDSWDGIGDPNGPDRFNVTVDGVVVFSYVFNATSGTSNYTPPAGGLLSSGTQLGFGAGQWFENDQAFDMSIEPAFLSIPHSASTVTVDFFASGPFWQGVIDESWAIDELKVSVRAPVVYCTAKMTSSGCVPAIGFNGLPSASAGSGFLITASQVEPNKFGLLFYSKTGQQAVPFQGGILCAKPPLVRTPLQNSGGVATCSGTYSMDFNAYVASGKDPGLSAGVTVDGQYWFRDPGFAPPNNTGLSNAIEFTLAP